MYCIYEQTRVHKWLLLDIANQFNCFVCANYFSRAIQSLYEALSSKSEERERAREGENSVCTHPQSTTKLEKYVSLQSTIQNLDGTDLFWPEFTYV